MDLETLNEYRGDNVENFWWYDIEPEEFFENWDEDDLQEFLKDNENLTKEEFEEMFEELKENWYGPVELNVLPDQNHDLSW
jgi:ribosomal protein S18 acetylase RimI-like enzyme